MGRGKEESCFRFKGLGLAWGEDVALASFIPIPLVFLSLFGAPNLTPGEDTMILNRACSLFRRVGSAKT